MHLLLLLSSQEYAVQNLLLYYDSDTQWPSIYKSKKVGYYKQIVLLITVLKL